MVTSLNIADKINGSKIFWFDNLKTGNSKKLPEIKLQHIEWIAKCKVGYDLMKIDSI